MKSTKLTRGIEISFHTKPANRRELVQSLEMLRQRVLEADRPGECQISEDLTEPNVFRWCEWWPEDAETAAIVSSERFQTLLGAIRLLGFLDELHHVTRSIKAA
jgi:hypothetical protein